MANQFYAAGETRSRRVHELFETIAGRYDLINDLQSFGLHRYWKRRVLQMISLRPGEQALDVCCGTGDLALSLARANGTVIGMDFSQAMLAIAKQRAMANRVSPRSRSGCSPAENPISPATLDSAPIGKGQAIAFIRGDALHAPFRSGQFDVVTIGYGLRNLADVRAGLSELIRLLRPGGRLAILDFGKPENAFWRRLYFAYLKTVVPLMGKLFCGNRDAYGYILESLRHFPAQTEIASMMRELGLQNVTTVHLLGGVMGLNYGESRR